MTPKLPRPPRGFVELASEKLHYLWSVIGEGGRISVAGAAGLLVLFGIVMGLRSLGRSRKRGILLGITGLCLVCFVALGSWSLMLPEPRGSFFNIWHQVIRVGGAVAGTGFVVAFMALAAPLVLDRMEGRGFIPFIASRHMRASKSGFLTVISFLSIVGVGVSSFALCAVVSIMGGFGADLKRKILGNNAHVRIEARESSGFSDWRSMLEKAARVPGVRALTPVVTGEAVASSSSNTGGVLLRGIDPESIGNVIDLVKNIEVGRFEYLKNPAALLKLEPNEPIGIGPGGQLYLKGPSLDPYLDEPDLDPDVRDTVEAAAADPGLIVGRELAKTLHVYVGDEVTLVSPIGDLGPMGVLPRTRRFRIAAIFYSGMYEYDAAHAYMLLDTAQSFLDMGQNISALEAKVENAEEVAPVTAGLAELVRGRDLLVRDWKEMNKNLFSALKLEKIATFIILSIAITVASFCILCTLLLMVTEKSKEIAILKALGASDGAILRIFMTEGMMIGGVGTVFGVVTGLASALFLLWFGVRLDPDVYYVDRLPISVEPLDYVLVAASAMLITTLATLYPARAASRLPPVDGIRYE